MNDAAQRIEDKSECPKENDEGEYAGIKQLLCLQHICQLQNKPPSKTTSEAAQQVQGNEMVPREPIRCSKAARRLVHRVEEVVTTRHKLPLSKQVTLQIDCSSNLPSVLCDPSLSGCAQEQLTLAYRTVNPMAIGRLTHVFKKGMTSAPLPGAVTTSTSCRAWHEKEGSKSNLTSTYWLHHRPAGHNTCKVELLRYPLL